MISKGDISVPDPSRELAALESFKICIEAIDDPKDAAQFAKQCEAAAKLYAENEAQADRLIQAAIYARRRSAELIKQGREAGIVDSKGGDRKTNSHNCELISSASLVPHKNDVSRNEKLRAAGDDALEPYFQTCQAEGKRITVSGAIQAAKKYLRDQSIESNKAGSLPSGFRLTGKQDVVSCEEEAKERVATVGQHNLHALRVR